MKTIEINPEYVMTYFGPQEEPCIRISRMNINFNAAASKLLALKKDVTFQFELAEKGNKYSLYFKDTSTGFKITSITLKGNAQLINRTQSTALFNCLSKHFEKKGRSLKFQIGEFHEGKRELLLVTQ